MIGLAHGKAVFEPVPKHDLAVADLGAQGEGEFSDVLAGLGRYPVHAPKDGNGVAGGKSVGVFPFGGLKTGTEDAKKMAAVKSPTELMQLQGELARRNFDAVVSFGSQRTEAWVKLYNDAFAPISNRVSVATEKMTKAA